MRKKPLLGFLLLIFALVFAILGLAGGAISVVMPLLATASKFASDVSVNQYYVYIQPYVDMVINFPFVEKLIAIANANSLFNLIIVVGSFVSIVISFTLNIIGRKLGGIIINIFVIIIDIVALLVFAIAILAFILNANYDFVRDLAMKLVMQKYFVK